jgi:hypothetical protein
MHVLVILVHMSSTSRTTVNLRIDLVQRAREYSGIKSKTELLHAGLEALIAREAARRLARMGGIDPSFRLPRRRRSA